LARANPKIFLKGTYGIAYIVAHPQLAMGVASSIDCDLSVIGG
jgi:hypothetical protein